MSAHDQHTHHHHAGYDEALAEMRESARHFYLYEFDWRGQSPPNDWQGPRWYRPSEEWRVAAQLDRTAAGTGARVTLPTSTGQLRDMTVAGQLVFEADGREQRLTAYLTHGHGEEEVLFVPFRDATSGTETYAAGRYLDVPYEDSAEWFGLDFNLAYSPTCAYSSAYDCPYPPPGNRLDLPVRAGEMNPFDA